MSDDKVVEGSSADEAAARATARRQRFETYGLAIALRDEAVKALEKAEADLSAAIQAIHASDGNGPFMWGGQELVIAVRAGKFFFRHRKPAKPATAV